MQSIVAAPVPARAFLTAEWRHLVMMNFAVAPSLVERFLPPGLEIDYFQGKTFVSVVGFRFLRTRVLGIPALFHGAFDEVNLRFYVKRTVHGQVRRGVMFIKELVRRRLVAWIARYFYNENYTATPLWSDIALPGPSAAGRARYDWHHGGRGHHLAAEFHGEPALPAPGSEAEFIAEHYWGYSRQRDGSGMEYQVEHPPWRVWPAAVSRLDCDTACVYGAEFAPFLTQPPTSAFVADGSEVIVRRGVLLR